MADQFGIDLGSVYRTAEAIKQSRFQRGAQETASANAASARDAASRFVGGDNAAFGELVSLDPAMAKTVVESFNALDDAGKKAKQTEIDNLGKIAAGVLSAKDPAAAYNQVLATLPTEERSKFPAQYDENFVRAQLGRATEVAKIYDTLAGEAKYTRERADKTADTATEQANALTNIDAKANADIKVETAKGVIKNEAAGAAGIESADSSLIFRQAAELLGGTFDQAGNLQALDPNGRAKAQEIATRASVFFKAGMTHAEAVKKAAQELGITFPGSAAPDNVLTPPTVPPVNPDDPAGLFN